MSYQKHISNGVSGIILAGGNSLRFQQKNNPWQDKALMKLDNVTLLERAIRTVSVLCNEIFIIINNTDRILHYEVIVSKLPSEISKKIHFEKDNLKYFCSGPILGFLTALPLINNNFAIVTPVDMPFLTSEIFLNLLNKLGDHSIILPYWVTIGKVEPLVFAFNRNKIFEYAKILSFIRKSRADDILRLADNIRFLAIAPEKEDQMNNLFININEIKQLKNLGKIKNKLKFESFDDKSLYLHQIKLEYDLLNDTYEFINKYYMFKSKNDLIIETLTIAEQLIEKNMFFYAGILLNNILNSLEINISELKENPLIKKIFDLAYTAFINEALYWEKLNIKLLALHSYSDALSIIEKRMNEKNNDLIKKIKTLEMQLDLKKKRHVTNTFNDLLDYKLSDFLTKIRTNIQQSEFEFNEQSPKFATDFLWDHSFRVGKIAFKLAILEGIDPLIPTLAALLHDSGKFVAGTYHKDKLPEEQQSASIAEKLLTTEDLPIQQIKEVKNAIVSLYGNSANCNIFCRIIHDADCLDKLGSLGVANFFTKMTLRGTNLKAAILKNLSQELTYALNASKSMLTESGKELAKSRSQKTLDYYKDLLEEYNNFEISKFFIKEYEIAKNKVLLVIPEKCDFCGGNLSIDPSTSPSLKCNKLKVIYTCTNCKKEQLVEFCLP